MRNRIIEKFDELRAAKRKGLIPFICGGRPSLALMGDVLRALEKSGAAAVEIGIPFSDPVADGPIIAAAMHEALLAGVTPGAIFAEVRKARDAGLRVPLAAMVSVSIVHRIGAEKFACDAAAAGFDGLIIPDVPLEESEALAPVVATAGLALTLLVAPTTPPDRAAEIAKQCTSFVYVMSRVGITGASSPAPAAGTAGPGLRDRIAALRKHTNAPIACGFGISSPEGIRAVVHDGQADAAIVGSMLVQTLEQAGREGRDAAAEATRAMAHLSVGIT